MSLLEDVFLQDEAGEAQELERVIEGDEYDERPRTPNSDDNSEKEDEAEENKRRVDPSSAKPKRVIKNPRFILNPARLIGPRGIQVIPDHFKDFQFKGKGHEKEDLDLVLKKLEHWAYRLYPKFEFEDCLKKIETLGKKRPVMVHLHKIRTDQLMSDETVVQKDSSDDEAVPPVQEEDEFDKLLQQQIELARNTPAPGSVRKPTLSTPVVEKSVTMPKATSSPSINEEQRQRILLNRQMAEERRLARLRQNTDSNIQDNSTSYFNNKEHDISHTVDDNIILENNQMQDKSDFVIKEKTKRSNVIDTSDSEDDNIVMNESVNVDIHYNNQHSNKSIDEINDFSNKTNKNSISNDNNTENNQLHVESDDVINAKKGRSEVIDSSGSEDNNIVMNEFVNVDGHIRHCNDAENPNLSNNIDEKSDCNDHNADKNCILSNHCNDDEQNDDNCDINEVETGGDECNILRNDGSVYSDCNVNSVKIDSLKQSVQSEDNNDEQNNRESMENEAKIRNINSTNDTTVYVKPDFVENGGKQVTNSEIPDKIDETEKQMDKEILNEEDVMDVDFSDDF